MPQYENRVVVLENPYDAAERQLNVLGLEGWRLVTVIDSGIAFLSRRPDEQPARGDQQIETDDPTLTGAGFFTADRQQRPDPHLSD